MKAFLPLLLTLVVLAFVGLAASSPQSHVIHIDHSTVATAFAKGGSLLATNNFKVQAGRREIAGEVEIHVEILGSAGAVMPCKSVL